MATGLWMIRPIAMTDAMLGGTDVTEESSGTYPLWNSGTTYSSGQGVHSTTSHRRYISAAGSNLNHNPATDDGTWWTDVGATERWRVFDGLTTPVASRSGSLYYEIDLLNWADGWWIGGVNGEPTFTQSGASYSETIDLVDSSDIVSHLVWATWEPTYRTQGLRADVPGSIGATVRLDIDAGAGTAELGEMVFGRVVRLGRYLKSARLSGQDYSTTEVGIDGTVTSVTERNRIRFREFEFLIDKEDEERVEREIWALSASTPTVFFGEENSGRGTTIFGAREDFQIVAEPGPFSRGILKVRGFA